MRMPLSHSHYPRRSTPHAGEFFSSVADRSNLAIQNVGSDSDGKITLRLTVFSGEGNDSTPHVLPDQVLAPGGWAQISGILASKGLSLSHCYVRIERISGGGTLLCLWSNQ